MELPKGEQDLSRDGRTYKNNQWWISWELESLIKCIREKEIKGEMNGKIPSMEDIKREGVSGIDNDKTAISWQ